MIKDYNDDVRMADYGRYCARQKSVREAREIIRDNAVRLGLTLDILEINYYLAEIITSSNNLIDAIRLDEPLQGS